MWTTRYYTANKTDYFISVADAMNEQCKAAHIGLDKPYITAYSAIDEDAFTRTIPQEELAQFRDKNPVHGIRVPGDRIPGKEGYPG